MVYNGSFSVNSSLYTDIPSGIFSLFPNGSLFIYPTTRSHLGSYTVKIDATDEGGLMTLSPFYLYIYIYFRYPRLTYYWIYPPN